MREARAVVKTARAVKRRTPCKEGTALTVPIRCESGLLADWVKPSVEVAVYRFYDANDVLLYVGITNNLTIRWSEHKSKRWWRDEAHRYDVQWYPNRELAKAAEKLAIMSECPKYNEVFRNPSLPPMAPKGQPRS